MKKHVVSAFVAAFAAMVGMAFEFEWEERGGGAVVTGCSGEASGLLAIPETLGGLPVRGIGYGAFEGQSDITSVSIPTNVEWIGMHAFAETKMFDSVTKPADVPVYSSDGKWLLGCRICYFTYKRSGATRKMHLPVDVKVKEGVEHLADGAFVGAEYRLQDGYTQFAAINSITLPSSLKTVGSAICNDMHLGLKVDFPTGVVEVADDFLAGANGVHFRFLGASPHVLDGRGWLDYGPSEIEGLAPAPTIVYYRDGADGWEVGGEFCGVTTWPRGCMEEESMKIRLGDVHCFGKYDEDVFIERESRVWSGEWVAIPVTGASKASQLKPLLVPCGGADASLVGTPAVWTDAKMFGYVAKPIVKKTWSKAYWADYGWGEVSFPTYNEYEDGKKNVDFRFPSDLWPSKKAVANRFWIVAKVNASRGTWSGPQAFRIGLKDTPLYSEPFSVNFGLSSPVAADGLFRGVSIESAGKLKFGGENTGNTGAPYDGAPRYSIEGKSPLVVKVSLGEAGTLVIAGGDEDCLEKGELKISGDGIVSDVFTEERSLEDAEFAYRFGACPYIRRVSVSGATTLTLKLPYGGCVEFGRMRFFPADGRSVAIDAGSLTPYTEVGVANRMAFARGYVTGTGVYKAGERATLTAIPGEGEAFDRWEVEFGSVPTGTDLTSPELSFVVPESACGGMQDEAQIFVRAMWKPRQSVTALPVPAGAATVEGNGQADENSLLEIEATRTGRYRFVDDGDSPTTCVGVGGTASDHEGLAYVRLEVRPPREDWIYMWLTQNELALAVGQSLSNKVVDVRSGSEVSVTASGLPAGLAFDARTNVLKGAPAKSGVHYITFTAKNANGFMDARVLRIVVGGAAESFQNGANVNSPSGRPFALTGLVVGEPIGTKTFYIGNYNVKKLKVAGLPPGLKAKVNIWDGGGCGACAGGGEITITGTPSKAGVYKVVLSGTNKKKTYKTVRTVAVQGNHPSLYMPVSLAADSVGRGTASGGGVKAFGSTVKLTAKSSNAKKYFFGGWYVGENLEERLDDYISCNSRAASVSFAVAAKREVVGYNWDDEVNGEVANFEYSDIQAVSKNGIYARFVTKEEDPISIDAPAEWRVATDNPLVMDVQSFSAYTLSVGKTAITTPSKKKKAAVSVSGNKLKVTNRSALKPGYHRLVLTAKNAAGNACSFAVMAYVPNLTEAVDDGVLELNTSDAGYTIQAGKVVTLADLGIKRKGGGKITAISGLPTGMKWDAKKQRLTGMPTKGGTFMPVFTVKYSSYCLGNRTYTVRASATFNVTPLPESVVGKFSGYTYGGEFGAGSRAVSVTTTSGGKITAKVGSLTFSKTGWGEVEDDWAAVTFTATRTVGKGKSAKTYTDVLDLEASSADWTEDGMSGTIKTYLKGEVVNADTAFVARKDVFASNEDAKAVAKAVAGTVKFGVQGAEAGSGYTYDLVPGTGLTATAKADGTVTLAGKIGSVSVSGTATLAVSDAGTATARFFSGKFVVEVVYALEDGVAVSATGRVWKQ